MESIAITSVEIVGLHENHNLRLQLQPGLNIIYGRNGSGKTTFLHVLANLLDRDIGRFGHIRFRRIAVATDRGGRIELRQIRDSGKASVVVTIDGERFPPVLRNEPTPTNLRAALREQLGGRPVYLPAFRSVLEAISQRRSAGVEEAREEDFRRIIEIEAEEASSELARNRSGYFYSEVARNVAYKSVLCREWFGPFVPIVRFPSLWEVSEELVQELHQAELSVAAIDRRAFSGVFVQVLRAVLSPTEGSTGADITSLLKRIRDNLAALQESGMAMPEVYQEIASMVVDQGGYPSREEAIAGRVLRVYDRALAERREAQATAFRQIRTFENSVNCFLSGKQLTVNLGDIRATPQRMQRNARMIVLADGRRAGLSMLSSGERHVLTLLFSATHMSITDGMLLIDEPELSLHIGWQRMILNELMKQAGSRQVVVCTHAPEVAAQHRNVMTELTPEASIIRLFDDADPTNESGLTDFRQE